MQKFWGKGSKPRHNCDSSHSNDNTGSFTHWATSEHPLDLPFIAKEFGLYLKLRPGKKGNVNMPENVVIQISFFFFFFFGHAHNMQKLLGQYQNVSHSSSDNAWSLTHCVTRELPRYPIYIYSFFAFFFKAASVAYGSSQARGWNRATDTRLCCSHSNVGYQEHLWPTPQLRATMDT